jgi:hypothetical protein
VWYGKEYALFYQFTHPAIYQTPFQGIIGLPQAMSLSSRLRFVLFNKCYEMY